MRRFITTFLEGLKIKQFVHEKNVKWAGKMWFGQIFVVRLAGFTTRLEWTSKFRDSGSEKIPKL